MMKRKNMAVAFAIAVVTTFTLGFAPTANANEKGCSNATIKGTFAEKDTGFMTNPPPAAASLFAAVVLETFDGSGKMTATGISSLDGTVRSQTETGFCGPQEFERLAALKTKYDPDNLSGLITTCHQRGQRMPCSEFSGKYNLQALAFCTRSAVAESQSL